MKETAQEFIDKLDSSLKNDTYTEYQKFLIRRALRLVKAMIPKKDLGKPIETYWIEP